MGGDFWDLMWYLKSPHAGACQGATLNEVLPFCLNLSFKSWISLPPKVGENELSSNFLPLVKKVLMGAHSQHRTRTKPDSPSFAIVAGIFHRRDNALFFLAV